MSNWREKFLWDTSIPDNIWFNVWDVYCKDGREDINLITRAKSKTGVRNKIISILGLVPEHMILVTEVIKEDPEWAQWALAEDPEALNNIIKEMDEKGYYVYDSGT